MTSEIKEETAPTATKILAVDDEPDLEVLLRQKFRRQIREGRLDFAFARDGLEAVECLEAETADRVDGIGGKGGIEEHRRQEREAVGEPRPEHRRRELDVIGLHLRRPLPLHVSLHRLHHVLSVLPE